MNWSNSALSFAWRRRWRNSRKSRCSSSRRRRVSLRYSSKAALPLEAWRPGPHQPDPRPDAQGPQPLAACCIRSIPSCIRRCQRSCRRCVQHPMMRPLPIKNPKVTRPIGHHTTKPAIIRAIQAGLPISSKRAAIFMAEAPDVNVFHIHIEWRRRPVKTPAKRSAGVLALDDSETTEIDEDARLEQLFRRHRHTPAAGIAAREERGDAVRQGPDMEAHHQGRRALFGREASAKGFRCAAQYREGGLARLAQFGVAVKRDTGLEHRRVIGRLVAGEGKIGMPDILERAEGVRPAVVPGLFKTRGEQLEPAQGDIGDQRVAVAEMTVGRGRTDSGPARRLGKGKAGRALTGDQVKRRLDQRLAQIAVVIAAALPRSLFRPPHVNDYNIDGRGQYGGASWPQPRRWRKSSVALALSAACVAAT